MQGVLSACHEASAMISIDNLHVLLPALISLDGAMTNSAFRMADHPSFTTFGTPTSRTDVHRYVRHLACTLLPTPYLSPSSPILPIYAIPVSVATTPAPTSTRSSNAHVLSPPVFPAALPRELFSMQPHLHGKTRPFNAMTSSTHVTASPHSSVAVPQA